MGSNKSGIIHNQTDQYIFYTLHSVDKVPQALVTKMSFGVKAGGNTNQGINAGGNGEYTKELKQKFAAKEGVCMLQPGHIGQTGLKKLDLDSVRHFSLISQSRDILTNIKIRSRPRGSLGFACFLPLEALCQASPSIPDLANTRSSGTGPYQLPTQTLMVMGGGSATQPGRQGLLIVIWGSQASRPRILSQQKNTRLAKNSLIWTQDDHLQSYQTLLIFSLRSIVYLCKSQLISSRGYNFTGIRITHSSYFSNNPSNQLMSLRGQIHLQINTNTKTPTPNTATMSSHFTHTFQSCWI